MTYTVSSRTLNPTIPYHCDGSTPLAGRLPMMSRTLLTGHLVDNTIEMQTSECILQTTVMSALSIGGASLDVFFAISSAHTESSS